MSDRILVWLGFLCLLIGLAPFLSVLISSGLASMAGCELHEGFANPCPVLGVEIGDLVYTMFVMGWFIFLTWPLAVGGAGLLLVLGIRAIVRRVRGRR